MHLFIEPDAHKSNYGWIARRGGRPWPAASSRSAKDGQALTTVEAEALTHCCRYMVLAYIEDTRGHDIGVVHRTKETIAKYITSRRKLRGDGQGGEFVDTGSCACNRHARDEGVHSVSGAADNVAKDQEAGAKDGDIATTKEIGKRTDEGTYRAECEEVTEDELSPSIDATNTTVDCEAVSMSSWVLER
ncbi:hypothetical protein LTS18_007314, partial [Coniosporium uncinatum]